MASIHDDRTEINDDCIYAYIDENGQKNFMFSGELGYSVELISTGKGSMTYTLTQSDCANEETQQVMVYPDIQIDEGDKFKSDIILKENDDIEHVQLINKDNEIENPKIMKKGTDIERYRVTVSNNGLGIVQGGGVFLDGQFCKVTATVSDELTFCGWELNGDYVSKELEYRFPVTMDVNLTGIFEKKNLGTKYKIKFKGNNATSGSMDSLERCVKDEEYTLPLCTFEKTGYKFLGWNTSYDGTGTYYPDGGKVKNMAVSDYQHVYLYAQWELERYSIVYNVDGGLMPDEYMSEYTIKTPSFDLPEPIRVGYK